MPCRLPRAAVRTPVRRPVHPVAASRARGSRDRLQKVAGGPEAGLSYFPGPARFRVYEGDVACCVRGLVASTAAPIVAAAGGMILLGACTSCQSTVREAAIPAIAAGSFDGVEADQRAHRLYLGDSAAHGIDVVDISSTTPRFVRTIDVAGAPNGLAVAEDTHRLYAGLIGGSVAVIDTDESSPKFMQMVDRVTVDSLAADLLDYSAQKQRVYVATGQSGEVVGIDTTTNQVKERLAAKVPVEQPRFNPSDGLAYAASPQHADGWERYT